MIRWIPVSNGDVVVTSLSEALYRNAVVALYGCSGSGTTTLLKRTIANLQSTDLHRPLRCVYAQLWKPALRTGNPLTTPAGFVTLNEVILGLSDLSTQYDTALVRRTTVWYREPKPTVTPRQFASMFSFVRDECRRLRIDAILIDNADELDRFALLRIGDLRQYLGNQIALVLCFKRAMAHAPNEHAETLLRTTLSPSWNVESLEVHPLSRTDIRTILLTWIQSYKLVVTATNEEVLAMRTMLWEETHGDWHRIRILEARLAAMCNHARNGTLSRTLWEEMLRKPLITKQDASSL